MRELLLSYGVRPVMLQGNPSDSFPERSTALVDQLGEEGEQFTDRAVRTLHVTEVTRILHDQRAVDRPHRW